MSGDEKQYQLPTITGAALPATATFPLLNPEDTTTPPADAHGSQQQITRAELAIALGTSLADIDFFVQSIVAGTNVTVDSTDPLNPIVSSTGGGGGGGFPLGPLDDATNTYAITALGAELRASNDLDADASFARLQLENPGSGTASAGLFADNDADTFGASVAARTDPALLGRVTFATNNNEASLYAVVGDPNGVLTAVKGDIAIDSTTPTLWQNTNSGDVWNQFSLPGSGFPVGPFNDATTTYEITTGSPASTLTTSAADNGSTSSATSALKSTTSAARKDDSAFVVGGGSALISEIVAGNDGNIGLTATDNLASSASVVLDATSGSPSGISLAAGEIAMSGSMGFFGATAIAKPTVTGSRGGNAALASLLTALANLGLITNSSS